jgi:hypothetical protein
VGKALTGFRPQFALKIIGIQGALQRESQTPSGLDRVLTNRNGAHLVIRFYR